MKKLIVLALIFSLVGFSTNLAAKDGAKLKIQKKGGQQISGELIAIKDRSLMLIDGSGAYVSSAIDEINTIIIGSKSKFWNGAIPGFILGAVGGAVVGSKVSEPAPPQTVNLGTAIGYEIERAGAPVIGGVAGGIIGGVLGATIGGMIASSINGPQETFRIEGKSQEEINRVLGKLRSKARFPDYQ
jgi:outer membrane lipoprotein SlyB